MSAISEEENNKVVNEPLVDRITRLLEQEIMSRSLAAGMKLSEPQLSSKFKVSRASLREAMYRLEGKRLITREPNTGARVVSVTLSDAIELFHAREGLEGIACGLAATRMSDSEIKQLRETVDEHEKAVQNGTLYEYHYDQKNLGFHYLIAKGCQNSLIEDLLCHEFQGLLLLFRSQCAPDVGRDELGLHEHKRIMSAIEDRDAHVAEILMRRHIALTRMMLEDRLKETPGL